MERSTSKNINHATNEAWARRARAVQSLERAVVREHYDFYLIAGRINAAMFQASNELVLPAAIQAYSKHGKVDISNIALYSKTDTQTIATIGYEAPDGDIISCCDFFIYSHEAYIELLIADNVIVLVSQGLDSISIQKEAESMRRKHGLLLDVKNDKSVLLYEKTIMDFYDGKQQDFPVKPFLPSMRESIGHFDPAEYCIFAARTGVGKSYFAAQQILYCAENSIPTFMVNLEMPRGQVLSRIWQIKTGQKIGISQKDAKDYEVRAGIEAWEWLKDEKKSKIKIENTGPEITAVVNAIRSEHFERGIQLAIVDYFQLLKNSGSRFQRHDVLADISNRLRGLSLDLNIPIIALAQISRESERTADKRPTIANLGGTTALENDATLIILGYRPSACDPPVICDENGVEFAPGYTDFTIAKGRSHGRSRHVATFGHVTGFLQKSGQNDFIAPMSPPSRNDEDLPF